MENKDKPASPMIYEVITVGDEQRYLYQEGLTKLEYAVIHNMPQLSEPNFKRSRSVGRVLKADVTLTVEDVARIDKTIEACRYALEALSNEE